MKAIKYNFKELLKNSNVEDKDVLEHTEHIKKLDNQTFNCYILNVNVDDNGNVTLTDLDWLRGSHRTFKSKESVSLHLNDHYLKELYTSFSKKSDYVIVGVYDFVNDEFIEYKQYENKFSLEEYKEYLKEIEFIHYNYCYKNKNNFEANLETLKSKPLELTLFHFENKEYKLTANEKEVLKKFQVSRVQDFLINNDEIKKKGFLTNDDIVKLTNYAGVKIEKLSSPAIMYISNILRVYGYLNTYVVNIKEKKLVSSYPNSNKEIFEYMKTNENDLSIFVGLNIRWKDIYAKEAKLFLELEQLFEI